MDNLLFGYKFSRQIELLKVEDLLMDEILPLQETTRRQDLVNTFIFTGLSYKFFYERYNTILILCSSKWYINIRSLMFEFVKDLFVTLPKDIPFNL